MDKQQIGQQGESLAATWLVQKGYTILGYNVRSGRWGELDLVCIEDGDLVFVEVKTRTDTTFGQPIEAVSLGKRRRLKRAAEYYKMTHPNTPDSMRFDVVTILPSDGLAGVKLTLYKNIDS